MFQWASEEVEAFDGYTLVGCYSSEKKYSPITYGNFLYPTYLEWCKKEEYLSIGKNKFVDHLVDACKEMNIPAEKKIL